ncbi:putative transmembrane protein YshB [Spirochaetia bacterium]|nr:putative transmembrane protein YshB [Spirochaetia bacterium]
MAMLDIIILVLMGLLTLRCALRGFIEELSSIVSIILGIVAAFAFFAKGGEYIRVRFMADTPVLPEILAFLILFAIIFLCGKLLSKIVGDIMNRLGLGGLDHFLGAVLGLFEGAVLGGFVIFILSVQPLFDPVPILESSFFARFFLPIGTMVRMGLSGNV